MGKAFAIVLGVALFTILGQGRAVGAELLSNGGFEEGTTGWAETNGVFDVIDSPVHGGGLAGRLSGDSAQLLQVYQWVEVGGSLPYEFRGWIVKNDQDVDRVLLRILWFDKERARLEAADSLWLTINQPDYQTLTTGSRVSPPAARFALVSVLVVPLNVALFEVYFDDLSFSGPPPPEPSPSPSPMPPPPPPPGPTATPAPGPAAEPSLPPAAAAVEPDVWPTLVNGGFEEGRADGTPVGWRKVGGEVGRTQAARAEGSYAAAFTSRTGSTKWLYQTVLVDGGAYYEMQAHILLADAGAAAAWLRLSWYGTDDGSGSALDSVDSAELVESPLSFRLLTTGPVQAPIAAHTAKVRLMLRPVSEAPTTAFFDAVTFTRVQSPTGEGPVGRGHTGAVEAGGERSGKSPSPTAVLGAQAGLTLANVRAKERLASAQGSGGGGSGEGWTVALAIGVPIVAVSGAAAYEWRKRRLAGEDKGNL